MATIREQELADVATVLATEQGRRFFWRLFGVLGLYQSTILVCPRGVKPEERLLYNGTRQEVAQMLHTESIAADPTGGLYLKMIGEARAVAVLKELDARKKQKDKKENDDGGSSGDPDPSGSDGTSSGPWGGS